MRHLLLIISICALLILTLVIINHKYLPLVCIMNKKDNCIESAINTENTEVIKRICNKYTQSDCINILTMMYNNSRDLYIPKISDEYCLNNDAVFCAFSAISYSNTNNSSKALKFSSAGCNLSEAVSCAILAQIKLQENSIDDALEIALKGCLIGSAAACAISGTILLEKGEDNKAAQFINRCCELGGDECCQYN